MALALAAAAVSGDIVPLCRLPAAGIAMVGVLIERWLFFVEVKHTVMLHYGRELGGS